MKKLVALLLSALIVCSLFTCCMAESEGRDLADLKIGAFSNSTITTSIHHY